MLQGVLAEHAAKDLVNDVERYLSFFGIDNDHITKALAGYAFPKRGVSQLPRQFTWGIPLEDRHGSYERAHLTHFIGNIRDTRGYRTPAHVWRCITGQELSEDMLPQEFLVRTRTARKRAFRNNPANALFGYTEEHDYSLGDGEIIRIQPLVFGVERTPELSEEQLRCGYRLEGDSQRPIYQELSTIH